MMLPPFSPRYESNRKKKKKKKNESLAKLNFPLPLPFGTAIHSDTILFCFLASLIINIFHWELIIGARGDLIFGETCNRMYVLFKGSGGGSL